MSDTDRDKAGQRVSIQYVCEYWWRVVKRASRWAHDHGGTAIFAVIVAVVLAGLSYLVVASAVVQLGVLIALLLALFIVGLIRSAASLDAESQAARTHAEDDACLAKQQASAHHAGESETPIQGFIRRLDELLEHHNRTSHDDDIFWNKARALITEVGIAVPELSSESDAALADLGETAKWPIAAMPTLQTLRMQLLAVQRDRAERPAKIKAALKKLYVQGADLKAGRPPNRASSPFTTRPRDPKVDAAEDAWLNDVGDWVVYTEGQIDAMLGEYECRAFEHAPEFFPPSGWVRSHLPFIKNKLLPGKLDALQAMIDAQPGD
jgi:hypothetical protein